MKGRASSRLASRHFGRLHGERITRHYVTQLAYLAGRLQAMPEGQGTVLDNTCILWLSNMFSGSSHDNYTLPILTVGNMGGALETGRVLNYRDKGDENRKLCSLYLSLMTEWASTCPILETPIPAWPESGRALGAGRERLAIGERVGFPDRSANDNHGPVKLQPTDPPSFALAISAISAPRNYAKDAMKSTKGDVHEGGR